jgi:hypothetical protein
VIEFLSLYNAGIGAILIDVEGGKISGVVQEPLENIIWESTKTKVGYKFMLDEMPIKVEVAPGEK